jgi:peptidoglycan/LPS O-acetylase OafA/YrhL
VSVPAARRLDGFDGLRALAAVLVIAYHAGSLSHASLSGRLAPVVAELKGGVVVFFIVSGFLLYLPYARAIRDGRGLPRWQEFAGRRAVRILPAYWVALALLAGAGLVHGVLTQSWWRFFGLAQIYAPSSLHHRLDVAWSLCTEITFYALLPVLAWTLARMTRSGAGAARRQLWALAGLALASLILRAFLARSLLAPVPDARIVLATSLPGLIDWFALGVAMAVLRAGWEHGAQFGPAMAALATRPGRCWLAAALLFVVGVPAQPGEFFLPSWGVTAHLALGLAAALLVLPAALPARGTARAGTISLLCSRPLAWLGVISYGIYLWHQPLMQMLDRAAGVPRGAGAFAGLFAATAAGAVVLGAASWYLVERPVQRWWRGRGTRNTPSIRSPRVDAIDRPSIATPTAENRIVAVTAAGRDTR